MREEIFKKMGNNYGARNRKKAARIEMVYSYASHRIVWVTYYDKKNRIREGALTIVGFETLQRQPVRNRYLKFYDILSERTVHVPADVMPEYMSDNVIKMRKNKLSEKERERVEKQEREIGRKARLNEKMKWEKK